MNLPHVFNRHPIHNLFLPKSDKRYCDAAVEMQIDELCVINQQMRTEVDWTGPLDNAPHLQGRV
jgi:hypothetical protein